MGRERRERKNTEYSVQILRADLRRFSAGFSRDCGAKKSCVAACEGLARGIRSLLRWCGSMGG
jgi:hypothetical protein